MQSALPTACLSVERPQPIGAVDFRRCYHRRRRLLGLAAVSQRDVNDGGFHESSSARPSPDDDAGGRSFGHKRHRSRAPLVHRRFADKLSARDSSIRREREIVERKQRRACKHDLVVSHPRPIAEAATRHNAIRCDHVAALGRVYFSCEDLASVGNVHATDLPRDVNAFVSCASDVTGLLSLPWSPDAAYPPRRDRVTVLSSNRRSMR